MTTTRTRADRHSDERDQIETWRDQPENAEYTVRTQHSYLREAYKAVKARATEAERTLAAVTRERDEARAVEDQAVGRLADAQTELRRWVGLTDVFREINGYSDDWPTHGNAPLAIAASHRLAADAIAERDARIAELVEVLKPFAEAEPKAIIASDMVGAFSAAHTKRSLSLSDFERASRALAASQKESGR